MEKTKINTDSGRSMVEMLGTLAIIGVLSVGGIAAYSYGMDKYRANTIMNDVMLRSVDVIAQFDRTGDANLDSWPTTTAGGYTIGLENETIGIQVDGLPKRICEMVFDGMINQATVKIGATEHDAPTDDDVCGDTNTMVFYVDEGVNLEAGGQPGDNEPNLCEGVSCPECQACNATSGRCEPANENLTCGDGGVCESGECVGDGEIVGTKFCSLDTDCIEIGECYACVGGVCTGDSRYLNGNNPLNGESCQNGSGTCYWGQCVIGMCSSNDECTQPNQYCADTNQPGYNSCSPSPSQCADNPLVARKITVNGNTQIIYVSKNPMTWWDADMACKAKGKELGKNIGLLSMSDFVSDWNSSYPENSYYDGILYTPTPFSKAIAEQVDSNMRIWTNEGSSCNAFTVIPSNGYTNSMPRSYIYQWNDGIYHFAVCK